MFRSIESMIHWLINLIFEFKAYIKLACVTLTHTHTYRMIYITFGCQCLGLSSMPACGGGLFFCHCVWKIFDRKLCLDFVDWFLKQTNNNSKQFWEKKFVVFHRVNYLFLFFWINIVGIYWILAFFCTWDVVIFS